MIIKGFKKMNNYNILNLKNHINFSMGKYKHIKMKHVLLLFSLR